MYLFYSVQELPFHVTAFPSRRRASLKRGQVKIDENQRPQQSACKAVTAVFAETSKGCEMRRRQRPYLKGSQDPFNIGREPKERDRDRHDANHNERPFLRGIGNQIGNGHHDYLADELLPFTDKLSGSPAAICLKRQE